MSAAPSALLTPTEYQILVEQAPIMIWRSDLSMGCDYFNERWLAFTGRTMEQERGNGWAEGVHPEDFQRCLDIYVGSFAKRVTFEMEYRLRRSDGEWRWIFDRGVPFSDTNGLFAGYIGSCIDVTERVEAQARLKQAKEDEIRQLKGLLPICAWCNRISDDEGHWQQLEVYVSEHSRAKFSHGICPQCFKKQFPEVSG